MADENIATERVFREGPDGVERLVAAPGDPIPDEDEPIGYEEKIDTRANTADAALAKGEDPPAPPQSRRTAESVRPLTVEPDEDVYADPLPKPGEDDADGEGEAKSRRSRASKARKSSDVENKSGG